MSYLDQITVGSTTYDIQDSGAQRKTIEGSGAPTTSTAAEVGTHYLNTSASSAPYEYLCIDDTGGSYTWVEVGGDPSKELPSGGTTGQVLTKSSGTNYDAAWADVDALPPVTSSDNGKYLGVNSGDWAVVNGVSDIYYGTSTPPAGKKVWIDPSGTEDVHSIPSGGTQGQVLTKNSATNYDAAWANVSHEIPSGGTQGQVLTKSSATDYDTAWANASSDKVMRVTVIYSNRTYSSDKTFDEILTAINDGYWVFVWYEAHEYELRDYSSSLIRFQKITMSSVANTSIDYVNIYKSNNQTTVTVSSDNIERTKTQLIYELVEDGNGGYEWDTNNASPLSYIWASDFGSVYLYIEDNEGQLPTTGQDDITKYTYQLEKAWQTEAYFEEEDQWETITNAIFSNLVDDNGSKIYKKFELNQWNGYWNWGSEYTTVTYSEETLGGGGSDKVMVVTITYASNTYSSDKTVDEILAEINGGGNVVLRYDGYEYQLKEIFGNEVRFTYVGVTTNSAREYRFRIYKSSNSTLVSYDTTSFYKTDVPEVLSSSFNITIVDNGCSQYCVLSSDLQDVLELYELQMSEPFSNVTGSLSISDTTNSNAHPNYDVYPLTGISWAYEYDEYEGGDNWKGTLQFSKAVIKNGHSYLRTITVAQFQNRYDGWYDAVITETETLIT